MNEQLYSRLARWSKARRVAATAAAGAVLMGSGIGIGIALTGGASAATTGNSVLTVRTSSSPNASASKCSYLAARLRASGHPNAAKKIHAFCANPVLRLGLFRGIYGQFTVDTKAGFVTLVFERGTVESVAGQVVTVQAADGTTWTWHLVANTVVRAATGEVPASELVTGEHVMVLGRIKNGVDDARLIGIRPAT